MENLKEQMVETLKNMDKDDFAFQVSFLQTKYNILPAYDGYTMYKYEIRAKEDFNEILNRKYDDFDEKLNLMNDFKELCSELSSGGLFVIDTFDEDLENTDVLDYNYLIENVIKNVENEEEIDFVAPLWEPIIEKYGQNINEENTR